jgi:polyhydroxyalkanoate synthesis regulator phasin
MKFEPVSPVVLAELREQVRQTGLRSDQARHVISELARTEAERSRLQFEVDGASEQRRALRVAMLSETNDVRERLAATEKQVEELEKQLQLTKET